MYCIKSNKIAKNMKVCVAIAKDGRYLGLTIWLWKDWSFHFCKNLRTRLSFFLKTKDQDCSPVLNSSSLVQSLVLEQSWGLDLQTLNLVCKRLSWIISNTITLQHMKNLKNDLEETKETKTMMLMMMNYTDKLENKMENCMHIQYHSARC